MTFFTNIASVALIPLFTIFITNIAIIFSGVFSFTPFYFFIALPVVSDIAIGTCFAEISNISLFTVTFEDFVFYNSEAFNIGYNIFCISTNTCTIFFFIIFSFAKIYIFMTFFVI